MSRVELGSEQRILQGGNSVPPEILSSSIGSQRDYVCEQNKPNSAGSIDQKAIEEPAREKSGIPGDGDDVDVAPLSQHVYFGH